MKNSNQLISIIIPVFNESESIGYLLDEVLNVMRNNKLNFEIIVVDDGSTDNTRAVARSFAPHPTRGPQAT